MYGPHVWAFEWKLIALSLVLMILFIVMLEVLVSSVYSVDQDKSWFAMLKAIWERFLIGLLKSNKRLKFTLKVAETFVKFAIPPPMIRIFPINKTQSHKEWWNKNIKQRDLQRKYFKICIMYMIYSIAYWSCDCPLSEQSKQLYTFAHKICS